MIDIYDAMWAPRLFFSEAVKMFKNLIDRKEHIKVKLPMTAHKEEHLYPRIRLRRDSFISLNGDWSFAPVLDFEDDNTLNQSDRSAFTASIRVPYPPESELSGLHTGFDGAGFAYRRLFDAPHINDNESLILNFGAVDQECRVFINGRPAGSHEGGYLPFSFDITEFIKIDGTNEITVKVRDVLNRKYPYGKQTMKPDGMWYTPVSGIWQTVWLECVNKVHVESFKCRYMDAAHEFNMATSVRADINSIDDRNNLRIDIKGTAQNYELTIFEPEIFDQKYPVENENGINDTAPETGRSASSDNSGSRKILRSCVLKNGINCLRIDDPMLWSPEAPYIYRVKIKGGEDEVTSYFTLRTVSIESINGMQRICLNHKPVFFHGVLDQGYFSDGLFTPVSDRYYEDDIRGMKELGFNVLRKHIKIEPERFYYDCDRLGMLVFQDMVNNGEYSFLKHTMLPTFLGQWKDDTNIAVADDVKEFFIKHSEDTVRYLEGFGCIVYYTVFNEGWGQFESLRVTKRLKEIDPDKIYDAASGWFKPKKTDVSSDHFYYHKIKHHKWKGPVIISECGGFARLIKDHSYSPDKIYAYGYDKLNTCEAFTDRIVRMYDEEVIPNMSQGICGSIYTQLSDVETEMNGLYTFDRAECKVDKIKMRELSERMGEQYEKICGSVG
jgi:hypothetical protein